MNTRNMGIRPTLIEIPMSREVFNDGSLGTWFWPTPKWKDAGGPDVWACADALAKAYPRTFADSRGNTPSGSSAGEYWCTIPAHYPDEIVLSISRVPQRGWICSSFTSGTVMSWFEQCATGGSSTVGAATTPCWWKVEVLTD